MKNMETFVFGDICQISIPEELTEPTKIQKNLLILKTQNIKIVMVIRDAGNNIYCVAPCREKKKKGSVRAVIGNQELYVRLDKMVYLYGEVLTRNSDLEIKNREETLTKIRSILIFCKPSTVLGENTDICELTNAKSATKVLESNRVDDKLGDHSKNEATLQNKNERPLFSPPLKQIPVTDMHDRGCPMCRRTINKMAKIEYTAYQNEVYEVKRFGNAFLCEHCNFAFVSKELLRMMENNNAGYKIYTVDITSYKSADEVMAITQKIPTKQISAMNSVRLPFSNVPPQMPNLSRESGSILIYSRKCHCQKCFDKYGISTIENRTAVVDTVCKETIQVNVMFCMGCGAYYMNYTSFENYHHKYCGLLFEFKMTGELEKNKSTFLDLNEDSILSRCGYSVRKGISQEYRQARLSYILESEKADKFEIIELISSFIEWKRQNPKFSDACKRWREDIAFVNDYKIHHQKRVYGLKFAKGK